MQDILILLLLSAVAIGSWGVKSWAQVRSHELRPTAIDKSQTLGKVVIASWVVAALSLTALLVYVGWRLSN